MRISSIGPTWRSPRREQKAQPPRPLPARDGFGASGFGASPVGRPGFTLIEMMVSVLILALLAGAVVPLISHRAEKERLRAAAFLLSDTLAYCYSSAVTEGRRYKWAWNPETRSWACSTEVTTTDGATQFKSVLVGGRRDEVLPSGIEVEGVYFPVESDTEDVEVGEPLDMPPEINFYRDGHCDSASVVLQAGSGEDAESKDQAAETEEASSAEAMTVSVNGITGRVKLASGNTIAEEEAAQEGEETSTTEEGAGSANGTGSAGEAGAPSE